MFSQSLALVVLFKPGFSLFKSPALGQLKQIALNLYSVFALRLADYCFDSLILVQSDRAQALWLELLRTAMSAANVLIGCFPRQVYTSYTTNTRLIYEENEKSNCTPQ